MQGPELRTIFLGMDQKRDELLFSSVKGKNPFKDVRVRKAFYQAIDIEAIKTGDARRVDADGADGRPRHRGFVPDMNKRFPYDPEAAKKLLAEAGYPNGFEVTMNCPNDRYVNDGAICQAVAANLARIGVKINLQAETKVSYFPKILSPQHELLPARLDAEHLRRARRAVRTDGDAQRQGPGQFNLGSYSNAKFDELTTKIQSETDQKKRNAMIREAFKIHQDDVGHLPLHQQALAWGMRQERRPRADGRQLHALFFKWVVVK
jgi:peptide/nickel transport system substrate-binding protein